MGRGGEAGRHGPQEADCLHIRPGGTGCETACSSFQSNGAGAYDVILPRATANSQVTGSANSTLRAEDIYTAHSRQEATLPKEGKSSQVFRNPYVWD